MNSAGQDLFCLLSRCCADSIRELMVSEAKGKRLQVGEKAPSFNSKVFQPLPNRRLRAGRDQKFPKVLIFIAKALDCLLACMERKTSRLRNDPLVYLKSL
jgi:hypothetical protein